MSDDLNTAKALVVLEQMLGLKKTDVAQKLSAAEDMLVVLGLEFHLLLLRRGDFRIRPNNAKITEAEIETRLAERREARAVKDFARSDAIRDELAAFGVDVMDGDPLGWEWRLLL